MKKLFAGLTIIVVLLTLFSGLRVAESSADSDRNPIVGSWQQLGGESGVRLMGYFTFFADGNLISTDLEGVTWHGAWKPVGDEVAYTIEAANPDSTGMGQIGQFPAPDESGKISLGRDTLERVVVEDEIVAAASPAS